MVGVLALVHVAGTGRPRQEIVRLFIMLGASAAALSDLIYLSHIAWWGPGAIQATPDLIALGRAFEVVDSVGHYLQWAGFLVLALGLICLAATLGADGLRRRGLGLHAHLQAGGSHHPGGDRRGRSQHRGIHRRAAAGLVIGPSLAIRVGHALAHDPQRFRPAEPAQ